MNDLGRAALLALVTATAACSTPSSRIDSLYASLASDAAAHPTGSRPDPKLQERHNARAADVREVLAKGELKTARDRLRAAVLLVESNRLEDLSEAEQLARRAALDGERKGFRVAAEAVDKQLVLRHLPQRYGTQYEWVVALRQWRLYPVDPTTTDADRRAMDVPSLAEIRAAESRLNP